MIYPLLPIFLTTVLSAGPGFLGVIEGFAESTASLMKLASGWLSDRVKARKPLVFIGYGLSTATRPLIALAVWPWHVLVARGMDRVGKGVRTSPRDALISESAAPEGLGAAFGVQRAMDNAGAIIGPLVAFAILWVRPEGYRLVFWLALIPGILALTTILFGVKDTPSEKIAAQSAQSSGKPKQPISREFKGYLVAIVVFTLGNSSDVFLLLRARELGVMDALLPILWMALHIVKASGSVLGGQLSDRLGRKRIIIAGWLIYVLVYLGFGFASLEWHAWALFLVYGLYFCLTEAPERALVKELAGKEVGLGTAFGAYHLAVGLSALPASLAFGFIWERMGAHVAFSMGAALAAVAVILFAALVKETHPTK